MKSGRKAIGSGTRMRVVMIGDISVKIQTNSRVIVMSYNEITRIHMKKHDRAKRKGAVFLLCHIIISELRGVSRKKSQKKPFFREKNPKTLKKNFTVCIVSLNGERKAKLTVIFAQKNNLIIMQHDESRKQSSFNKAKNDH